MPRHLYTLLGGVIVETYRPHSWSDGCPSWDDGNWYGERDTSCMCAAQDVSFVNAVIAVWVEGRPISAKPGDVNFHVRIWKMPGQTLRDWEDNGAYSMLWDHTPETTFTLASTVDPRDQELSYRAIIKPYMEGDKLPKLTLSTATFRGHGARKVPFAVQLEYDTPDDRHRKGTGSRKPTCRSEA